MALIVRRRWRFYRTESGQSPVKDFVDGLPDEQAAHIAAAMKAARDEGLDLARHLRDDIYEVRARAGRLSFRILFSVEGKKGRILLALCAFSKKTPKTPQQVIGLAETRLADWRRRSHD
ncbi:MAG: type II toxin-antitoxin system RelE/ParE family toxin [Actinomycetota bacterium]